VKENGAAVAVVTGADAPNASGQMIEVNGGWVMS
jgi:hypothetical protein